MTANADLLDQCFTPKWAQKYIPLFDEGASQVMILGESAGGISVPISNCGIWQCKEG